VFTSPTRITSPDGEVIRWTWPSTSKAARFAPVAIDFTCTENVCGLIGRLLLYAIHRRCGSMMPDIAPSSPTSIIGEIGVRVTASYTWITACPLPSTV
jgi:hypothetical protein